MFKKATKEKARLRVAIDGPAKSGKTYTALVLASAVIERFGGRIALIDTERGSASKYANLFDFDVAELVDFHPDNFIKAIGAASQGNTYAVLVIDSLSHEWMGDRGILQLVDQAQSKNRNQFAAWRVPSGLHTKLVDAMLQAPIHLIATMRSKTEYAQIREGGKTVVKKVGLKPVQRDGVEYEFDILVSMDNEHQATISGSRCPEMDGQSANKPAGDFFHPLLDWISEGDEPAPKKQKQDVAPKSNGWPARPWDAETLKRAMAKKASQYEGPATASDKQRKFAVASLSKVAKDTLARYTITLYLFNKESSKELAGSECSAIIDWVGAKPENDFTPDPHAASEAASVISEYHKEHGQTEMTIPEEAQPADVPQTVQELHEWANQIGLSTDETLAAIRMKSNRGTIHDALDAGWTIVSLWQGIVDWKRERERQGSIQLSSPPPPENLPF